MYNINTLPFKKPYINDTQHIFINGSTFGVKQYAKQFVARDTTLHTTDCTQAGQGISESVSDHQLHTVQDHITIYIS